MIDCPVCYRPLLIDDIAKHSTECDLTAERLQAVGLLTVEEVKIINNSINELRGTGNTSEP